MDANSRKIRLILIDDNDTIHAEIGGVLKTLDDIDLVAQGHTGEDAITLCEHYHPELVLMDISMPVMDGITATKVITAQQPDIRIVALSGRGDAKTVHAMIEAGAVGYVLKDTHPEELANTIRTVCGGSSVFSTDLVKPLLAKSPFAAKSPQDYGLTRRELDILREMSLGLNNGEVADKLHITTATVRFHLTNIIQKLGAENRTEALIITTRQKLI